eukprot:10537439-Heterocapsa_arctica.AAC.1
MQVRLARPLKCRLDVYDGGGHYLEPYPTVPRLEGAQGRSGPAVRPWRVAMAQHMPGRRAPPQPARTGQ